MIGMRAVNFQTIYWWQYRRRCLRYAGGVKFESKLSNYLLVAVSQAKLAICRGIIMTINEKKEKSKLSIALEGRLDTMTAPQLEAKLKQSIGDVTELSFDFAKLEYISSAGLRVLLFAQKVMNSQGSMTVSNVNETVMEVFEVTGFVNILDIQRNASDCP